MTGFKVSAIAGARLDEIFVYTREAWGQTQAEEYITGLFDCFEKIVQRDQLWRAIPADFGLDGYFCRHKHHYIYWRVLTDGSIGVVTILHERMHLTARFREDNEP